MVNIVIVNMKKINDRTIPETVDAVADDAAFDQGKSDIAFRTFFAPAAEEQQYQYSGSDAERVASQSSVITITIDGHQVESCGSTIVFEEDGLKPDVDYKVEEIKSSANSLMDINIIAGVVNRYKNVFGKPVVVIIQSQLGDPICAYSGKNVYWEVYNDLPKTTKLMIDGKALYVHRANFQIVDSRLLK